MSTPAAHEALANLLAYFATLYRTQTMYPAGHPLVIESVDRLVTEFVNLFRLTPRLIMDISREALFIGGRKVADERWIRTFSSRLHDHGIVRITFHRGIGRRELQTFLAMVGSDTTQIQKLGGYKKILRYHRIDTISVDELQHEVHTKALRQQLETLSDTDVWRQLVRQKQQRGKGATNENLKMVAQLLANPDRFASIVNKELLNAKNKGELIQEADTFFYNVITFGKYVERHGGKVADDFQARLHQVLHLLSPLALYALFARSASEQFLLSNETRSMRDWLATVALAAQARALVHGLWQEDVETQEFARTYLHYCDQALEKTLLGEMSNVIRDCLTTLQGRNAQVRKRLETMATYDPILTRMAETMNKALTAHIHHQAFLLQFVKAQRGRPDLTQDPTAPEVLEGRAFDNLLAVLDIERENASYAFFLEGLEDWLNHHLETGQYRMVADGVVLLERHNQGEVQNEENRALSGRILEDLRQPERLDLLMEARGQWEGSQLDALATIFRVMGKPALLTLLRTLIREEQRNCRAMLVELLGRAGQPILPQIIEKLHGENWYVVRNMVGVVVRMQPENIQNLLNPMMRHPEPRVRKELAKVVCQVPAELAVDLAAPLLDDPDPATRKQAIVTMGAFPRSAQAAAALLNRLKTDKPFAEDEESVELAYQTLARILHPDAKPALKKYLNQIGAFSKFDEKTVAMIIRAFVAWEDHDCLTNGCKSWNKRIRQMCTEALAQAAG